MTNEAVYTIDLSHSEIDNICWALFHLRQEDAGQEYRDVLGEIFDKLKQSRCVENVAVQS